MASGWRRIVVKVGTSSLTDQAGHLSAEKLAEIARGVKALARANANRGRDAQVVIVSSGAGAAGRERLGIRLPLTLPERQAAAAVGQTLLMRAWELALAPAAVAQLLLSAGDIQERERYVNAKNALEASLELGAVPIVNENDSVATAEIKLGDNDTLSAWVSYLVGAEALVILTDVDGLYDLDPRHSASARRIDLVEDIGAVEHLAGGPPAGGSRDGSAGNRHVSGKAGSRLGTGGMATKLRAARIAVEAGIETLVIGGGGNGLTELAAGRVNGTRFLARTHVPARKAWIANQPRRGVLRLDEGAAKALAGGRSLLPRGITAVEGIFAFGDAVELRSGDEMIAVGLSNYASEALARIGGRHTSEIAGILGVKDYDEVVHRDNLVLRGGTGLLAAPTPPARPDRAGDSIGDP